MTDIASGGGRSAGETVDIGRLIDDGAWTGPRKMVLFLCALAVVLDGLDSQILGFAIPALIKAWGAARADFAPAVAIGFVGLALGGFIGGPIGDRLGRRFLLIASVFLFGAATAAMALAGGISDIAVCRFISGLGLGAALARPDLGDVGQQGEGGETVRQADGLIQRQLAQQALQLRGVVRGRVAVIGDGGPPHRFDAVVEVLPALVADHLAQQGAQQPDLLTQAVVGQIGGLGHGSSLSGEAGSGRYQRNPNAPVHEATQKTPVWRRRRERDDLLPSSSMGEGTGMGVWARDRTGGRMRRGVSCRLL